MLDVTDLAQAGAGGDAAACRTRTASTWPGPTPTSRPGTRGLVILDIENPEQPQIDQVYNAGGLHQRPARREAGHHLHQRVRLPGRRQERPAGGAADRRRRRRATTGFSPRPTPQLIATFKLPHGGHALAIAKGLDRDRAVDESGNQIGVFGRVGARPLNAEEQRKLYLRGGRPWFVTDDPKDIGEERRTGRATVEGR